MLTRYHRGFGIWTWVIIAFAFFLVSRFFYAPILLSFPTNDVLVMICYNNTVLMYQ